MNNPIERFGDKRSAGWRAGQSGNPGGKQSFRKAAIAAGHDPAALTKELVETAVTWMRGGSQRLAQHAHQWLSDHLLGKPKEHVQVDAADSTSLALVVAARMTPHERQKALDALESESDHDDSADES